MSAAEQLYDADMKRLLPDPSFLRFIWRVLDASGYLKDAYGTDGRNLVLNEGRRHLGLEVLRLAEMYQPDALIRILVEAQKIPKEATNGRRSRDPDDRDDD